MAQEIPRAAGDFAVRVGNDGQPAQLREINAQLSARAQADENDVVAVDAGIGGALVKSPVPPGIAVLVSAMVVNWPNAAAGIISAIAATK
jgi:hypothetical protein